MKLSCRCVIIVMVAVMYLTGCTPTVETPPASFTPSASSPSATIPATLETSTSQTQSSPTITPMLPMSPDEYIKYLNTLSEDVLDSIPLALEKLKELPAPIADKAVDAFLVFHSNVAANQETIQLSVEMPKVDPAVEENAANAYTYLFFSEGYGGTIADTAVVGEALAGLVSPEYAAYFELASKIKEHSMRDPYNDGALMISWDDLSDSILWRLEFSQAYPAFRQTPNVLNRASSDAQIYLGIIPINARIYDWEKKTLTDAVKDSYLRYLSLYPDSELTPYIADVLNVWEKEGYKYNKTVQAYLESLAYPRLFSDMDTYAMNGVKYYVIYDPPVTVAEDERLLFENGVCGLMDDTGRRLTPFRYYSGHKLTKEGDAVNRFAFAEKSHGKLALFDERGVRLTPYAYNAFARLDDGYYRGIVHQSGKTPYQEIILDKDGNELYKTGSMDWLSKAAGEYLHIDNNEKNPRAVLLDKQFHEIKSVELAEPVPHLAIDRTWDDRRDVIVDTFVCKLPGKDYGVMDAGLDILIPHEYADVAMIRSGFYTVSMGEGYALADRSGKLLTGYDYARGERAIGDAGKSLDAMVMTTLSGEPTVISASGAILAQPGEFPILEYGYDSIEAYSDDSRATMTLIKESGRSAEIGGLDSRRVKYITGDCLLLSEKPSSSGVKRATTVELYWPFDGDSRTLDLETPYVEALSLLVDDGLLKVIAYGAENREERTTHFFTIEDKPLKIPSWSEPFSYLDIVSDGSGENQKFGLVDRFDNIIAPYVFDMIQYPYWDDNGSLIVIQGNAAGYIDYAGKWLYRTWNWR